jgi:precorrin-2/cobalt-factor-2 C20-methyltransferase
MMPVRTGTLYGVGLGPGDPDLMSVKAHRLVTTCPVIAYFRKRGRPGHARTIVNGLLPTEGKTGHGITEIPLEYPVTTEAHFNHATYIDPMREFYSDSAGRLRAHLDNGHDIALLCEGDPFFYGSFLHMYDRLRADYSVVVVPGITGMSGCWTAAATPITYGDDVMTVLPGTLDAETLVARLTTTDAAVIMKVGRNLEKIRTALRTVGRLDEAIYVERGTMAAERVVRLADLDASPAPYFAIILLPGGRGRRIT